jgi:hypothetical protein
MSREPDGSRSNTSARVAAALTAVALLPVLIVVITRTGRRYVPVGDIALIDLRVRDVWSRAIPLVGPYSRLGWNHPGPAMFWLIAPLSGLTGRPAWATLVGGVLLQGVAIVAIARLAWRKGGVPLVAAALAVNGLAYGAVGPSMLLQAWNPNVTYPFLLVLLLAAWCLADGDLVLLPFTAAVATFLVQTHVGYLPLVAVAVAFGLAGAFVRTRPKAGEVLIEIRATGVCHTDEFTRSGADPEGLFPVIFGHEGAGVVVDVGPGVSLVKKGDRVILSWVPDCGH